MRIAYISNLPPGRTSGGFSGMNVAMFEALRKCAESVYVGPIDPPPSWYECVPSKLKRAVGLQSGFTFFSEKRLNRIAREISYKLRGESFDLLFFHGFTPWIGLAPGLDYAAWSDCSFRDYIEIFHDRNVFTADDLKRIEEAEARWLGSASLILFTSQWSADRAIHSYNLNRSKVRVVGIFGALEPPTADIYAGDRTFAFISTNFEAKGGLIATEAIARVRKKHHDVQLMVVGDTPSNRGAEADGVLNVGFLRKEVPVESNRLRNILATIRGVIHPSRADISPLVLVEAAYFGCPAIASRKFAIPEIVEDRVTGILLDNPCSVEEVSLAILWLLEKPAEYARMRKAAWARGRQALALELFETRVYEAINNRFHCKEGNQ